MTPISTLRTCLIVASLGLVCGCDCPADPPPVVASSPTTIAPIKPDTTIPRELGPLGSDEDPSSTLLKENELTSLHASMNSQCLAWKREGAITFGRVWEVLAAPAKTQKELARKAIFVRYSIPEHQIGRDDFEGGTARLLIAIFRSDQHALVRTAALSALRGNHLEVSQYGRVSSDSHLQRGFDGCPAAVLEHESPEFAELARDLLTSPRTGRSTWCLRALIRTLVADSRDLPATFGSLEPLLIDYLSDSKETESGYGNIVSDLAFSTGPRSGRILASTLRRSRHAPPRSLLALLRSLAWSLRRDSPELQAALVELAAELAGEKENPDYKEIFEWLERNTKIGR